MVYNALKKYIIRTCSPDTSNSEDPGGSWSDPATTTAEGPQAKEQPLQCLHDGLSEGHWFIVVNLSRAPSLGNWDQTQCFP